MKFTIEIPAIQKTLEAKAGQTILRAAFDADVAYPYSCQSGKCGICKSRLISGEVQHLPHNRFILNESEKKAGVFLACSAVPQSNVQVAWLEDGDNFASIKETVVVESVTSITEKINRLCIQAPPNSAFKFRSGQYINIKVGDCPPRSYSMANSPSQTGQLEFLIKEIHGGCASHTVAKNLIQGERIEIQGPMGNAYLRKNHTGPILLVAAGSGLAPILSIIRDAIESHMRQEIYLYFGVYSASEIFYQEVLRSYANRFQNIHVHFVAEKDLVDGFRAGRVSDVILADWPEFRGEWQTYLAGPPQLIETLVPQLEDRGMPLHQMFTDPFYDQTSAKL